jgi:hypothetical protein
MKQADLPRNRPWQRRTILPVLMLAAISASLAIFYFQNTQPEHQLREDFTRVLALLEDDPALSLYSAERVSLTSETFRYRALVFWYRLIGIAPSLSNPDGQLPELDTRDFIVISCKSGNCNHSENQYLADQLKKADLLDSDNLLFDFDIFQSIESEMSD